MVCKRCGKSIKSDAKLCPYCGKAVRPANMRRHARHAAVHRAFPLAPLVATVAVLLVLLTAGWLVLGTHTEEQTGRRNINSYRADLSELQVQSAPGQHPGGEVTVLTLDPWAADLNGAWAQVYGEHTAQLLPGAGCQSLVSEQVSLQALEALPKCELLIWVGHGGHLEDGTLSLATGQPFSQLDGAYDTTTDLTVSEVEGYGAYWSIQPEFIKKYVAMDNGLAYLDACSSGYNDSFAEAFLGAGAETVFVEAGGEGDVLASYAINMLKLITLYMTGEGDGVFHTAGEALELANQTMQSYFAAGTLESAELKPYVSLEEFITAAQGGTHIELRGEGAHTLCACIRGQLDAAILPQGEIIVLLTAADGTVAGSVSPDENGQFYFNNLAPGEYSLILTVNGEYTGVEQSVTVERHRYAAVTLPAAA